MATCNDCVLSGICAIQLEPHYVLDRAQKLMRESNNVEHECLSFKDRSQFINLPFKVGNSAYGIIPWGNSYKIVQVYVEEIIFVLRRDENSVAQKGIYDIKIRPLRRKPIDLSNVFFTPEEAEQALKEREI